MARRRKRRRRSSSYEADSSDAPQQSSPVLVAEDLSPRARRLIEGGVIDLATIAGSGEAGRITTGDILHHARVMEMEQSVARIEMAHQPTAPASADSAAETGINATDPTLDNEESATSLAAEVHGDPIEVEPSRWDDYNGTSEGLSASARPGADQSWGEAEAHLAAIEAATAAPEVVAGSQQSPVDPPPKPDGAIPIGIDSTDVSPTVAVAAEAAADTVSTSEESSDALSPAAASTVADVAAATRNGESVTTGPRQQPNLVDMNPPAEVPPDGGEAHPATIEGAVAAAPHTEVMMDFGTLELVDPDSVWAEGAEDFAPWFLAHSQQLGDVLGLEAGLSDARQFTTKSATGVLGNDDSGAPVVVVSSKNATADDSDLGRALGMAASSGAASVALVTAALQEDQLKALAWLNNQTKSGVRWYGIEMRVVRIADSPAAMLFDLVAAPPDQ